MEKKAQPQLLRIKNQLLPSILFYLIALLVIAVSIFLAYHPFAAKAIYTPISLSIDGIVQTFATTPYIDNSTHISLVPLEEIFTKLGISFSYNSATKSYLGAHARSSILVSLGSSTAYYDSTPLNLGAPTATVSGVTMMDLSFIENLYGTTLDQSQDKTKVEIKTNKPYSTFDADDNYVKKINTLAGPDILSQPSALGSNHGSAYFTPSANCANSEITITGQTFTNAVQNKSSSKNFAAPHSCQLNYKLNSGIAQKDVLIVEFVARCIQTDDPYGNAYAMIDIAKSDGSYNLALNNDVVTITADWQTFFVPFDTSGLSMPLSSGDRLRFLTAYGNQTIQIGEVKLINLSQTTAFSAVEKNHYRGQSSDAIWRKAALDRIQTNRTSPLTIKVKDIAGTPVQDAEVAVEMTKSDFTLGAALSMPDLANDTTYGGNVPPFFSLIEPENSFKWTTYEDDGCTGRKGADYIYNHALSNNHLIRGHNLIWDEAQFYPSFADYNPSSGCTKKKPLDWRTISESEAAKTIAAHISKIVAKYPDIVAWDVWNEPVSPNKRLLRDRFGDQFFAQFFNLVESINPKIKKYINDYYIAGNHDQGEDELISLLKSLKSKGAKVDGIGAQTHVTGRTYPQDIYNQIANVANYVDEVAITEYDIRSRDEALGADYLRDALILAYSHPKTAAFITWNYRDKADGSRSSLVRRDYSKKPAYFAMEKQIAAWQTKAAGKTDSTGIYSTPAYHGTYKVTARSGSSTKTVTYDVSKNSANFDIILKDVPSPDCDKDDHKPLNAKNITGDVLRIPDDTQTIAGINSWIYNRPSGTVIFKKDFTIDETILVHGAKNITITSENQVAVLMRGSALTGSLINGDSDSTITLENIVLDGANTASPVASQAVYTTGSAKLSHTTIRYNNSNAYGAGLMINGNGTLSIANSSICLNTSSNDGYGGGLSISGKTVATIANSYLNENKAHAGGGINLSDNASLTITDSVVQGNKATESGGGLSMTGQSKLNFKSSTVSQNSAGENGGGLHLYGSPTVSLESGSISKNTATNSSGGGIFIVGGTINVAGSSSIDNNQAKNGAGGGIFAMGTSTLHISGGVITKNTAGGGSAFYASTSNVTLSGTPIVGIDSTDNGVHLSGASTTMKIKGDLASGSHVNIKSASSAGHGRTIASKQDSAGKSVPATSAEAKFFYYQQTAQPALSVMAHKTNYLLSEPISSSLNITSKSISIAPGKVSSAPHSIQIGSNNHDGYILTISTSTTDNALKHAPSSTTIPAIASSKPTALTNAAPAWGYRTDGVGSFGAGPTTVETNVVKSAFTWAGVPTSASPATIITTTSPDLGYTRKLDIYYAAFAPRTVPAGNYSNTIVYTLIPQS
jgi:GH35 family endo-1,4-beta-xylanase